MITGEPEPVVYRQGHMTQWVCFERSKIKLSLESGTSPECNHLSLLSYFANRDLARAHHRTSSLDGGDKTSICRLVYSTSSPAELMIKTQISSSFSSGTVAVCLPGCPLSPPLCRRSWRRGLRHPETRPPQPPRYGDLLLTPHIRNCCGSF